MSVRSCPYGHDLPALRQGRGAAAGGGVVEMASRRRRVIGLDLWQIFGDVAFERRQHDAGLRDISKSTIVAARAL